MDYLKNHRSRMAQKRALRLNLKLLLIGFIAVIILGTIGILKLTYGEFIAQAFEVAMISRL
jgi:heme/copper-type cytochrome/quinol oxidase subunit 4